MLQASEYYPSFRNKQIPEISDIWIDEQKRGKGLGTLLITHLEQLARDEGFEQVGIGVGLYQDYGPAQKLYFKRGYMLDGMGITYQCLLVTPGGSYPVDDDLILWLVKPLT